MKSQSKEPSLLIVCNKLPQNLRLTDNVVDLLFQFNGVIEARNEPVGSGLKFLLAHKVLIAYRFDVKLPYTNCGESLAWSNPISFWKSLTVSASQFLLSIKEVNCAIIKTVRKMLLWLVYLALTASDILKPLYPIEYQVLLPNYIFLASKYDSYFDDYFSSTYDLLFLRLPLCIHPMKIPRRNHLLFYR